mgnify:CR=1 FL=1
MTKLELVTAALPSAEYIASLSINALLILSSWKIIKFVSSVCTPKILTLTLPIFNGSLIADVISASGVTITTGENFEFSASAINAAGSFTLDGAAAVSANITMVDVSASSSVALSFGSMSGDLLISSLNVIHDLTISGENAAGLGMTLHKLSASGITISLGEVGDASNQFSASAIAADNFTLNAGNFKDSIYLNDVSVGSAMTITIGESVDDLAVSSINTELFTFNGGDSTTFSATMTSVDIAGSAWTITMPEMGNGLTINNLSWSANGTIVGTQEIDSIRILNSLIKYPIFFYLEKL